ncbi:hypothetical protein B0T14DRAFT_505385 [Immersiella caudata]|uniref:N-acetyltransferase domain-containing protein n=1 Tax=Immersiella caudata TaxID=314043 RepID=A0AA39XF99_9PEZI|nr:hypothetical protein B0T14DRAFT_505385 [Immersiella caudata]
MPNESLDGTSYMYPVDSRFAQVLCSLSSLGALGYSGPFYLLLTKVLPRYLLWPKQAAFDNTNPRARSYKTKGKGLPKKKTAVSDRMPFCGTSFTSGPHSDSFRVRRQQSDSKSWTLQYTNAPSQSNDLTKYKVVVAMMTSYRVRDATPADAIAIIHITSQAFSASDSKARLRRFPERLKTATSDQEIFDWRVNSLRRDLDRTKFPDSLHAVVVCDGDAEKVVGWVEWQAPSDGNTHEPAQGTSTMSVEESIQTASALDGGSPPGMDLDAQRESMEAVNELVLGTLGESPNKNMWIIQGVAVSISHQRRGIGSMLVRWGLEKAEASGRDACLVASGPGRQLCLSLGFDDLGHKEILGEIQYSMIKRIPSLLGRYSFPYVSR